MWTAILGILDKTLGFLTSFWSAKNTPDMKKAKEVQLAQEEKDRINKEIAKGDLDQIRKDLSS